MQQRNTQIGRVYRPSDECNETGRFSRVRLSARLNTRALSSRGAFDRLESECVALGQVQLCFLACLRIGKSETECTCFPSHEETTRSEQRAIDSCKKKRKKRKEKKTARNSGFPCSTDIEREKKMFGCPPYVHLDDLMDFKVIAKARAIIFAFSHCAAANRDLSMRACCEIFL
jgi:hypothetical protein